MSTISKTHCIECECIIEDGHLYCINCDPEEYNDMGPQDVVVEVEEPIVESIEIKEITRLLKENEDLKYQLEHPVFNQPIVDQELVNERDRLKGAVIHLQESLRIAEVSLRNSINMAERLANRDGQIEAYKDIVDALTKKLIEASDHGY